MCLERNEAAPASGCLITTKSTFIAKILFTVSISDSPLERDELLEEKFKTSAESLFSASSKDNLVLVEFSKKQVCYGNIS